MQLQHGVAVSSSRIPWEKEVSIVRDSLIHSLKKSVGFNIGGDDAGNCNEL